MVVFVVELGLATEYGGDLARSWDTGFVALGTEYGGDLARSWDSGFVALGTEYGGDLARSWDSGFVALGTEYGGDLARSWDSGFVALGTEYGGDLARSWDSGFVALGTEYGGDLARSWDTGFVALGTEYGGDLARSWDTGFVALGTEYGGDLARSWDTAALRSSTPGVDLITGSLWLFRVANVGFCVVASLLLSGTTLLLLSVTCGFFLSGLLDSPLCEAFRLMIRAFFQAGIFANFRSSSSKDLLLSLTYVGTDAALALRKTGPEVGIGSGDAFLEYGVAAALGLEPWRPVGWLETGVACMFTGEVELVLSPPALALTQNVSSFFGGERGHLEKESERSTGDEGASCPFFSRCLSTKARFHGGSEAKYASSSDFFRFSSSPCFFRRS